MGFIKLAYEISAINLLTDHQIMNKIKLLFLAVIPLFLTACATTLPPAEPSSEMMKKADTILLKVDQTPDEAYTGFAQHLSDFGYSLENTSDKLRTIKTNSRSFDDASGLGGFSIGISVSSSDSTMISVTGTAGISGAEIQKETGLEVAINKFWDKMNEIALDYTHEAVYYSRN